VSTEALAYIIIPLEKHQESKASSLECLKNPSYVKILKDFCTQAQKSRNHFTKKILRSKQFYIRWRNILPEGYEVLKKKWWKGLVGHPHDQGRHYKKFIFQFIFYTSLHKFFLSFFILCHFILVSNNN
jgi:hypothetical protein